MNKVIAITGAGGNRRRYSRPGRKMGYTVCVNYVKNATAANSIVEQILQRGGNAFSLAADASVEADVVRYSGLLLKRQAR